MVGIAQLVRASGCGSEGRGFESHYLPHLNFKLETVKFQLLNYASLAQLDRATPF